jgi:hypothetical protein
MAIHVYRFRAQGPNTTDITQEVPGTVTFSAAGFLYVDYSADSTNLQDLTDALAIRGWVYDSTDPTMTPAQQAAANGSDAINFLFNGTLVAKQPSLNIVSGATVVNNAGANRIDITIPSGVGLGSATPSAISAVAGAAGSAPASAHEDHTHQVTVGSPVAAGTANADGSSNSLARADHVHAVPFTAVNAALGAANASVSVNGQKIVNLAEPVGPQDAATKAYVDATQQGLDPKESARVSTIAALPANTPAGTGVTKTLTANANGTLTIDGVLLALNDRVLVKDEASAVNNGVYYVTAAGSGAAPWVLTRATDANATSKVTPGLYVFVEEGTQGGNGYVLTTVAPITLDTTGLVFSQFSGAGQITAGTGMTKSGNTLNVVAHVDGSILVHADDIQVGVISDAQHGTRGGGTTHSAATGSVAGFMSAADKTKLDGISATPADDSFTFGNFSLGTSTTARFLSPGYDSAAAPVITRQFRVPRAGTIKSLRVHSNTAGVGASNLTFTVRKNNTNQTLSCTFANTIVDGQDLANSFAVAAGDLLDVTVTKSASLTTSPIDVIASVDFAP